MAMIPMQEEVVVPMYNFSTPLVQNTPKTLTISNGARLRLIGFALTVDRVFDLIIATSSNGTPTVVDVTKGSKISYTKGTGTITLTATDGGATVYGQVFYGSVSE